jgi:hypothetical protein
MVDFENYLLRLFEKEGCFSTHYYWLRARYSEMLKIDKQTNSLEEVEYAQKMHKNFFAIFKYIENKHRFLAINFKISQINK